MKKFWILPVVLLAAACAATARMPDGMKVRVVDEKTAGCELLDDVDTMDMAFDKDESLNYIRNRTARAGGDTVHVSRTINYNYGGAAAIGGNNYTAHKARMYKCDK